MLNKTDATILVISLCFITYCVFNWWLRLRFVVDGYKSAGSYKKKSGEYIKRWSFPKRLVLFPLFCTDSTMKYRVLGVINYFHFLITVFTICGFIFSEWFGKKMICWQHGMLGICIVCVFQIVMICFPKS